MAEPPAANPGRTARVDEARLELGCSVALFPNYIIAANINFYLPEYFDSNMDAGLVALLVFLLPNLHALKFREDDDVYDTSSYMQPSTEVLGPRQALAGLDVIGDNAYDRAKLDSRFDSIHHLTIRAEGIHFLSLTTTSLASIR